jgi:hypothetical protein
LWPQSWRPRYAIFWQRWNPETRSPLRLSSRPPHQATRQTGETTPAAIRFFDWRRDYFLRQADYINLKMFFRQ